MEPVTHVLTGACLARAGFNRRAAYATLTMVIAAEMPDIDVLWRVQGPVESFAHHRGITHTFIGLPVEAAILVAAVYGLHRLRVARAKRSSVSNAVRKPLTAAPVRWGWLYLCAIIALLSHLLLDYTNNYGIRPFYPFDGHWYAASIVFIFDPIIFLLLLLALVTPPLFGLVNAEVGGRRQRFRGRGMAIGALVCIVALWAFRYVQRNRAEEIAFGQTYELQVQPVAGVGPVARASQAVSASSSEAPDDKGDAPTDNRDDSAGADTELVQPPARLLQVQRVEVSPDPVNPFRWSVAMDYGALYQLATVDVRRGEISPDQVTYPKVNADAVLRAAEASPIGRAYLDWSPMPILSEEEPVSASRPGARPVSRVTFRDPRFMGDTSWVRLSSDTPLTAVVTVDDSERVVRQTMDGNAEPAGRGAVADVHWSFGAFGHGPSAPRATASNRAPAPPTKTTESRPAAATSQPVATPPKPETPLPQPAPAVPPPPSTAKVEASAPAPKVVAPKPVVPSAPAPQPVKTTVAPAPAVSPVAASAAVAPAPSQPAAVVSKPVAAKAKPALEKTEPNVLERAYEGAAARVHRFEAWLHWLINPR